MKKKKGFFTRQKFFVLGGLIGFGILITLINLFVSVVTAKETDHVVFPSADGLTITADVYLIKEAANAPFMVLFHQANWSRGEYRETAPRFNNLGYNCIAVDLRSGSKVKGVQNMTAQRATEAGKQTRYVDAMQDMIAALKYVKKKYNPSQLLIVGSSYSAALALKIAGDYPGLSDGVIAFSPGEYFVKSGMSATWIKDSAKKITKPVFVTSAKKEKNYWSDMYDAIDTGSKIAYLPPTKGNHGSRALWKQFPDNQGYWSMLEAFLKSYF